MKVLGLRDPLTMRQAVGRVVARAQIQDFARSHEIVERPERLLLRRVDVLHVNLIEIDAVRLEAPQAVFHGADDAVARGAGGVGAFPHAEAKLRGEHHAIAAFGLRHPRAHDALGQPVLTVDVGGVDEAHAPFERAAHDRARSLLVAADLVHERLVVGFAERHRSEAENGDLEPTTS
jgi:hypothetical protein